MGPNDIFGQGGLSENIGDFMPQASALQGWAFWALLAILLAAAFIGWRLSRGWAAALYGAAAIILFFFFGWPQMDAPGGMSLLIVLGGVVAWMVSRYTDTISGDDFAVDLAAIVLMGVSTLAATAGQGTVPGWWALLLAWMSVADVLGEVFNTNPGVRNLTFAVGWALIWVIG